MKILKNIKLFTFAILISSSLFANADYTAKIFIDGLSMKSEKVEYPDIIDGDITEQLGGVEGEFTFKISRTSGYNHNSFILTVLSKTNECFKINNEFFFGEFPSSYCYRDLPDEINIDVTDKPAGIYNFVITTHDDSESPTINSYNFTIEVLAIDSDIKSDGDLTFGYFGKVINQGTSFSLNITNSTFGCYKIKLLTNNYGYVDGDCPTSGYPVSRVIELSNDLAEEEYTGVLDFVIEGYNNDPITWDEIDNKIYPFSIKVNPKGLKPSFYNWKVEFNAPAIINSFNSPFFGFSNYSVNNLLILVNNTKEIKVDIIENNFTTGWTDANGSENVRNIIVQENGTYTVKVSIKNGSEIVTETKSLYLAGNAINNFNFKFCYSGGYTCPFVTNSMAIWEGGTGDYASITFSGNNIDCVTIQSNDDPNYNTPIEKCWGTNNNAVFELYFENHDPINKTSKNYTYNFSAYNYETDEEIVIPYTVNIYYD